MKLKKRFILISKEDAIKDARLRRVLTVAVLIFSVAVPLLNDGVIYTLVEYTAYDVAILWLNAILRYVVVILRYLCIFISYAAVITGIFHFGFRTFKTPSLLLIAGSIIQYVIAQYGSYVFCYDHYIVSAAATDAAAVFFNYLFLAVLDMIKNATLIIICCRFAKKAREEGLPDCSCKPEKIRLAGLLKTSLKRSNPFFGFCIFAAGVEAAYGILSRFFSVTLFQLISGGAPKTVLNYAELLSGYTLIIPLCAAGFVLCISLCTRFSYLKPAKRK